VIYSWGDVIQLALSNTAANQLIRQLFEQDAGGTVASITEKKIMPPNPESFNEHLQDFEWLEDHIYEIYDQIKSEIQDDRWAHRATRTLLTVMPFVSTRPDLSRWKSILINALVKAQVMKDIDSQIQIWTYLAMCFFRSGEPNSAIEAVYNSLNHIDGWVTPEINLTARIGMLHGQNSVHFADLEVFIDETLHLAKLVEDEILLAHLHFKLAVIYTQRAQTDLGLGHAETAYGYWTQLRHTTEQDRTLQVMAEACWVAGNYDLAKYYLSRSLSRYTNEFLSATADYHDGAIAYMSEDYDTARTSQEKALLTFQQLDGFPYLTGAAHHALGLTYIQQQAFTKALRSLRDAMKIWLELDNLFEQANALYGLGFMEERQGHFSSAREYYLEALDRLAPLPASALTDDLRENINENLDQLTE